MYEPSKILAWLVANVEGMRLSRSKTMAAIVSAAMLMRGIGVLALGRAMSGEISAKHCIKRVWRFLRNEQLETEAVFRAMFRDLKNRDWGLGLDHVRLTQPQRHDRHFAVIALAYVLLAAFGAIAEKLKIDRQLKANTRKDRVMNLARIGNYFLQIYYCPLENAFYALLQLPT